jgi:predicted secreted hydrolase
MKKHFLKLTYQIFLLVALAAGTLPAGASLPYTAFQGGPGQGMPLDFMSFHPLTQESGYCENWNFYVQGEDGTLFSASLAITNLGLHTFDCTINATLAPRGQQPTVVHKEYRRRALKASTANYDVRIGGNRAWGAPPLYHLRLREDTIQADLDFSAELPPYRRGDGTIRLGTDGKMIFATGMLTPRARVHGTVNIGGQTHTIEGSGYHDHTWQTIKMTDLAQRSSVLRLWDGDLTLVLQDMDLTDTYGGAKLQVGLLGQGNRIVATSSHYTFEPQRMEKEPGSPIPVRAYLGSILPPARRRSAARSR